MLNKANNELDILYCHRSVGIGGNDYEKLTERGQYQDNFAWSVYVGKSGDGRYGIQQDYVAQKILDSEADLTWALNQGGSQAHNNMPPYRTVYMYRRTA